MPACASWVRDPGVKLVSIEGNALSEKKNAISQMDGESWLKLCATSGFAMVVAEGSLVMLPPGFLLVSFSFGDSECHSLRWSFIPPELVAGGQYKVASETMRLMLAEFPVDEQDAAFNNLSLLEAE